MFIRAPKPSVAKSTSALSSVNTSAALRSQISGQRLSVRRRAIIAGSDMPSVRPALTSRITVATLNGSSFSVRLWSVYR
jgi:hypothetical protein